MSDGRKMRTAPICLFRRRWQAVSQSVEGSGGGIAGIQAPPPMARKTSARLFAAADRHGRYGRKITVQARLFEMRRCSKNVFAGCYRCLRRAPNRVRFSFLQAAAGRNGTKNGEARAAMVLGPRQPGHKARRGSGGIIPV